MSAQIFTGAAVFDGDRLHRAARWCVEDGRGGGDRSRWRGAERLAGGILAPGLIDLQVNGGGGRMVDGRTDRRLAWRRSAPSMRGWARPASCRR